MSSDQGTTVVNTTRSSHSIDILLTRYSDLPALPFELRSFVSEEEWESRLTDILEIVNYLYKPVLERLYVSFAVIATVALPIVLITLTSNASMSPDKLNTARFVGLAVLLVIGLVLWVPYSIWKALGARRLKKALNHWEEVDRIRFPIANVPRMEVKPPSIFRSTTILRLISSIRNESSGSKNSVPSFYYQNFPASAARAYFYPYQKREKGMPHMSVVGAGFDSRSSAAFMNAAGSERRTSASTFYKEYFEEVEMLDARKPNTRTPISGTMAGGRTSQWTEYLV